MKNEEITWYKNRIIKLVKESEDLRLLKLIHRIAENLLGTLICTIRLLKMKSEEYSCKI